MERDFCTFFCYLWKICLMTFFFLLSTRKAKDKEILLFGRIWKETQKKLELSINIYGKSVKYHSCGGNYITISNLLWKKTNRKDNVIVLGNSNQMFLDKTLIKILNSHLARKNCAASYITKLFFWNHTCVAALHILKLIN